MDVECSPDVSVSPESPGVSGYQPDVDMAARARAPDAPPTQASKKGKQRKKGGKQEAKKKRRLATFQSKGADVTAKKQQRAQKNADKWRRRLKLRDIW